MEALTYFVEVLLPLPLPRSFTYRVPNDLEGAVDWGLRVVVPFGSSKVYTGIILEVHHRPPSSGTAKYLLDVLDLEPQMSRPQLQLMQWMSEYYICHLGEVFQAAMPSGFKISSESKIQVHPALEDWSEFNEKERDFLGHLQEKGSMDYAAVASYLGIKQPHPFIQNLLKLGAILVFESLKDRYQPKIQRCLHLNEAYLEPAVFKSLLSELASKPKQLEALLIFAKWLPLTAGPEANARGMEKKRCLELGASESAIKSLLDKEILVQKNWAVSRFDEAESNDPLKVQLSPAQEQAYQSILAAFQEKEVALLHGWTGSGKTEIYTQLIQEVLATGQQVLFLVPEIALSTQMVLRLKRVFGNQLGVYHSRFSDNERVEVWQQVKSGQKPFILGVRSSIFLPFDQLGLIVIDEEHEASFKQQEPAPRYHARDAALVLAKGHGAKVLLGSATPSIESYYHAKQGKYALIELKERFSKVPLPKFHLIPTKAHQQAKTMKGGFAPELLSVLRQNMEQGKQSLIFQNRRGYAPYLQCQTCDWIAPCPHCDVSLTYHAQAHALKCHYCGHSQGLLHRCSSCGSTDVKTMGYGTEKIEEELQLYFPQSYGVRIDLESTRSKTAFQQMVQEIQSGKVDFIVGTQMVAKGLDFDHLQVVAVFDADRMLHFPDFRSHERAFQMITQVAGRAGRRAHQGQVYLQTQQAHHPVLDQIIRGDYAGLYADEIAERQAYRYPPFVRLIRVILKHEDRNAVDQAGQALAAALRNPLGSARVLGAQAPIIERIRNKYAREILLKLEKNVHLPAFKQALLQAIDDFRQDKLAKGVQIIIDVDPI